MSFLLGTKLGQAIILAGVILACWAGFRWYYINEGQERCRNAQTASQLKASADMIAAQRGRDSTSSAVAAESAATGATAVKRIEAETASRQETIRREYPVMGAPATCSAVPVPEAVQADFDAAVREINDAR